MNATLSLRNKQKAKIRGIFQKVAENPTWTAEQVIAWAVEVYKIKPTTAKIYLGEARKRFRLERVTANESRIDVNTRTTKNRAG